MAQLIKLSDCISRYQLNLFRYVGRFSDLKQRRWMEWEHENLLSNQYSEVELRNQFRKEIESFQLKWASSTLEDSSLLPKKEIESEKFRFLMDHFPDNYLLLYHPIFQINKAATEVEVFLLSPSKLYCISFIENSKQAIITAKKSNFWLKTIGNEQEKLLSPFVSINRMAEVVKVLIDPSRLDYQVEYIIIAPNGYIEIASPTSKVTIVDLRNKEEWLTKMQQLRDPIKFIQLKAANQLLQSCMTTATKR